MIIASSAKKELAIPMQVLQQQQPSSTTASDTCTTASSDSTIQLAHEYCRQQDHKDIIHFTKRDSSKLCVCECIKVVCRDLIFSIRHSKWFCHQGLWSSQPQRRWADADQRARVLQASAMWGIHPWKHRFSHQPCQGTVEWWRVSILVRVCTTTASFPPFTLDSHNIDLVIVSRTWLN